MSNKIYPESGLEWENDFTLLGVYIDIMLENLRENFNNINRKVVALNHKWKPYHLCVHGGITITKPMLPRIKYGHSES